MGVSYSVVGVAQLVEHQVVALVAVGSSPIAHPVLSSNVPHHSDFSCQIFLRRLS